MRRHHIANAIDGDRRLRFTATRVEAFIAVDGLVFPELCPVKICRKIGAALHVTGRIHVDCPNARAALLRYQSTYVLRNFLEVVVRVRDDSAIRALESLQLSDRFIELGDLCVTDEPVLISVLRVSV